MNNCETCKHWGTPSDEDGWSHRLRFVAPPSVAMEEETEELLLRTLESQFKTCTGVLEIPDANDLLDPEVKAYTVDGSEYKANLRTRATFGCVQWKGPDHELCTEADCVKQHGKHVHIDGRITPECSWHRGEFHWICSEASN